jgi:hypothetical protein
MGHIRRLLDVYQFPGFRPKAQIKGIFGDPKACVLQLERRQKKQCAGGAVRGVGVTTTARRGLSGTSPVEMRGFIWKWQCGESFAGGAGR